MNPVIMTTSPCRRRCQMLAFGAKAAWGHHTSELSDDESLGIFVFFFGVESGTIGVTWNPLNIWS